MMLQTQWKSNEAAFIGLDYTAVAALFTILKTEDPKSIFHDLRAMEYAALKVLNQRRDS